MGAGKGTRHAGSQTGRQVGRTEKEERKREGWVKGRKGRGEGLSVG